MKHQIFLLLLLSALLVCGSSGENCDNEKHLIINGCPWTLNISCNDQINAWQLQCRNLSNNLELFSNCSQQSSITNPFYGTHEETCRLESNCQCNNGNGGSGNNYITISLKQHSSYDIKLRGHSCSLKVIQTANGQTGKALSLNQNKTWIKALQSCRDSNSTLVEITSQTVQDAVSNLINETGLENGVWVGLERSIFGINPEWMWTSRNKTINPGWTSNHPVDPLNNHCGKVEWVEGEVKLVDENCHKSLPFICQD